MYESNFERFYLLGRERGYLRLSGTREFHVWFFFLASIMKAVVVIFLMQGNIPKFLDHLNRGLDYNISLDNLFFISGVLRPGFEQEEG